MSDRKGKRTNDYSDYSYVSVDVIRKAVNGEKDAMEQIIIRYRPYVKAIIRGVAAERNIKLFGELSFDELGTMVGLQPKQAEMAYFYTIRKLRKELGAKKDEF